jgi:hypothetical protein
MRAEDVISENPFFQKRTVKQERCQIDYMIQNGRYELKISISKMSL